MLVIVLVQLGLSTITCLSISTVTGTSTVTHMDVVRHRHLELLLLVRGVFDSHWHLDRNWYIDFKRRRLRYFDYYWYLHLYEVSPPRLSPVSRR